MPGDLFGHVTAPLPSVTRSKRSIVLVSIVAHAVMLAPALFFSFMSPGLLPAPRTALAFFDARPPVQLLDIDLPAPARPAATAATTIGTTPTISLELAPVIAPQGIGPEQKVDMLPVLTRPSGLSQIENVSRTGSIGTGMHVERPTAPVQQAPVRLHSGIREPEKLVHVDPVYPAHAQSARVQGVVILEAVIGTEGRVDSVRVLRSIMLLDQAAITAVRQWQYRPATLNGSPVSVIVTITVNFTMEC